MKYIKILFSILLSILFAVILMGGLLSYTIRSFVSKENVKTIVAEMNIETLIQPDTENIPELFENFLYIPEVMELIERITDQAVDYILANEEIPSITDADIDLIVHSDYYEHVLGSSLPEEMKAIFTDYLKESFSAANEKLANRLSPIRELFEHDVFKLLLSDSTVPVAIISLVILVGLIGVCRWSWYRPLAWAGTATLAAGGLSVILTFIVRTMLSAAVNNTLIDTLARRLSTKWVGNGLITLCIGIGVLIGYAIINSVMQRRSDEEDEPDELAAFPRKKYNTNHIAADIQRIKSAASPVETSENQKEPIPSGK